MLIPDVNVFLLDLKTVDTIDGDTNDDGEYLIIFSLYKFKTSFQIK